MYIHVHTADDLLTYMYIGSSCVCVMYVRGTRFESETIISIDLLFVMKYTSLLGRSLRREERAGRIAGHGDRRRLGTRGGAGHSRRLLGTRAGTGHVHATRFGFTSITATVVSVT